MKVPVWILSALVSVGVLEASWTLKEVVGLKVSVARLEAQISNVTRQAAFAPAASRTLAARNTNQE